MLPRVMLGLLLLLVGPARAAEFTANRPVHIVVPVSPGGSADVLARIMAQAMTPLWGQQVVVESRTGAGGHIAGELVARSPGDGHTLLFGTIAIHAAAAMYSRLGYDPAKDLAPVALLVEVPFVVTATPQAPFRSLAALVAAARARPGEITFGSAGNGTSTHMAGELFQQVAGIRLQHVPYRGSSQSLNDVMAGTISLMFENLPTIPPVAQDGRVLPLAVTSATRVPQLPNVPTAIEAGQPDFVANAFFTLVASGSTPEPLLARLNRDLRHAMQQPETRRRLLELGNTPRDDLDVPAIRAYFAAETLRWGRVISTAGLKAD